MYSPTKCDSCQSKLAAGDPVTVMVLGGEAVAVCETCVDRIKRVDVPWDHLVTVKGADSSFWTRETAVSVP